MPKLDPASMIRFQKELDQAIKLKYGDRLDYYKANFDQDPPIPVIVYFKDAKFLRLTIDPQGY
jgi:hypothetical protein